MYFFPFFFSFLHKILHASGFSIIIIIIIIIILGGVPTFSICVDTSFCSSYDLNPHSPMTTSL